MRWYCKMFIFDFISSDYRQYILETIGVLMFKVRYIWKMKLHLRFSATAHWFLY